MHALHVSWPCCTHVAVVYMLLICIHGTMAALLDVPVVLSDSFCVKKSPEGVLGEARSSNDQALHHFPVHMPYYGFVHLQPHLTHKKSKHCCICSTRASDHLNVEPPDLHELRLL